MNGRLHRLSIFSWPIWVKLLFGFVIAVFIPAVLIVSFLLGAVAEATARNALEYLEDASQRQRQVIGAVIQQAQSSMNGFVGSLTQADAEQILPAEVGSEEIQLAFARRLQDSVLNVGGTNIQSVELIDARGVNVLQAYPGRSQSLVGGESRVTSQAYSAGIKTSLRNERQDTIVFPDRNGDHPVIQIVNLIQFESETGARRPVMGYLVATLDAQSAIFDYLSVEEATRVYLVTNTGLVITSEGLMQGNTTPFTQHVGVQRALDGREGTENFSQDGVDYFRYYGPVSNTRMAFIAEASPTYLVGEISGGLVARSFALIVGLLFLIGVLVALANQLITPPLGRIISAIQAMSRGNFDVPLPDAQRQDEIGALAASFADVREWVQTIIADLETRIAARVRDIEATQDISHYAATERDLQRLMDQVVNLIVERFSNIYHAQIFLIDKEGQYAVLRASTGEPGRKLLQRGHRLAVGSVSVIGQTTDQGEVVVARDTASSTVHKRNEFLPDTLAELAIPLRVGNRVIGALDVQSKQVDAFSEDQVNVLQTMADQISIAIENARLYQESLLRLEEIERNRRASTLQAWREYALAQRAQTFQSEAGMRPVGYTPADLRQTALEQGQIVIGTPTERRTIPIAVPIRLRDQILGAVEWEVPQDNFDQNKIQLAQELTNRLAVSLENARLFHESQRATERERVVNDIAARLTSQTDIDQILQTAVREVGQALRSPQVTIRLNPMNGSNGTNGSH